MWTKESETRYWFVTQLGSGTLVKQGKAWTLTAKRDGQTWSRVLGRRPSFTHAETLLVSWGCM
jgi:hypothetical protein